MLLLSCVSLLALVACSEESGSISTGRGTSTEETDLEPLTDFKLSIEIISDEELEALEIDNEFTHINYGIARDLLITDGINLRFTFDQPVTDFSLITVAALEDGTFAKTGVIYEVSDLNPEKPLVITHYFNRPVPESGFYFVDSDGESGWFIFQQNQMDGEMNWWPFDWSHDYDLFVVEDNDEVETDLPDVEDTEDMTNELDPINVSEVELSIIRMTPHEIEEGLIDFQNTIHHYHSTYDLEFIHLLNYNYLIEARHGEVNFDDLTSGDFLMIRTNVPLREFAVILMGNELLADGSLIYIPIESFGLVDYFRPEEGFVIHSYLSLGTIPWSGVTFLDENGVRQYHAIMHDQSGLRDPYFFHHFEDRTDELPPDWQPWW